MTIKTGDTLPEATLLMLGAEGPEKVSLQDKTAGRKVVIFAVPGAFTPTCHSAHVPSFIKNRDALTEKGIEEIICVAANDPFVMKAWGVATGATDAGITMLSDGDSSFTRAIGMDFDAAAVGLMARSRRYAMVVDNGTVTLLHEEEGPGTCERSGGEAILAAL